MIKIEFFNLDKTITFIYYYYLVLKISYRND